MHNTACSRNGIYKTQTRLNQMLMMPGSLIGHLGYGVFVAWVVPLKAPEAPFKPKMAGQH
jgi:hypothetical protein